MATAGTSTPRRRLTLEDRREEILASATELISAAGFNATSIDDFAVAAGMSRPGLLHHFPSREALLEAVLERRDEVDVATLGQDHRADSAAEAREILTALIHLNASRPKIVQLYAILSAEALSADHPAHEHFARRQARATEFFADVVLPWHPSPRDAAIDLVSFLDGLQITWLRDPSIDFAAHWERFADRFFAN